MRIITGKKRGLKLQSPDSREIRPTLDRVKESIFNIIHPIKNNSIVLDLFSGTGNIGLEFISRGAKSVYFVDDNKKSVELINRNINKCNFEKESIVLNFDYEMALENIAGREIKFDYIYIDPPYGKININKILKNILNSNIINKATLLIYEDNKDIEIDMDKFEVVDDRKYGKVFVKFIKKR